MDSLNDTIQRILAFRDARDWAQDHTPRNLSAALSIETSELQELLLWHSDADIDSLLQDQDKRRAVALEAADVLIYALLLCHRCGIEPLAAISDKIELNAAKYPVQEARGVHTKYTDL